MRDARFYLIVCSVLLTALNTQAQEVFSVTTDGVHRAYIDGRDTVAVIDLREVTVVATPRFKSKRDEARYYRLIRDVKRTLPYAKMVYSTLIETYEYMETLPNDGSREKHLKRMEKELFAQYKPELKKLTFSQGKLLIKLIDRECNQSSFSLVKAFLGRFRAGFWNFFAGMFGASLKTEYDPTGKDAQTERIVRLVEEGIL